jgi:hypothetical protein
MLLGYDMVKLESQSARRLRKKAVFASIACASSDGFVEVLIHHETQPPNS